MGERPDQSQRGPFALDEPATVVVRIPEEVRDQAKRIAPLYNLTWQELIVVAWREYVQREYPEGIPDA